MGRGQLSPASRIFMIILYIHSMRYMSRCALVVACIWIGIAQVSLTKICPDEIYQVSLNRLQS
jgi:hypothetical protein